MVASTLPQKMGLNRREQAIVPEMPLAWQPVSALELFLIHSKPSDSGFIERGYKQFLMGSVSAIADSSEDALVQLCGHLLGVC